MEEADAELFKKINAWFEENLLIPDVCQTGKEMVVTYFKVVTTAHMLKKLTPVMELLDKYNHPYDVVYTNFVGDIVYEDAYQVAVRV